MSQGSDCVEEFKDHIEDEVKGLYETFSQQPMIELTDVLKKEMKKNVTSVSKSLTLRIER